MIDSGYFWTIILFLALGTLLIRGSIIAIAGKVQISDRVRELFSFIPAAILPAFVAPAVFFHQGQMAGLKGKERLLILVFAVIVSLKTRSTVITIIFGLIALYAFVRLGGGI